MRENVRVSRRVGIEIVRRQANPADMFRAVRAEKDLLRGLVRLAPFPIRMRGSEMGGARCHPRRALGMTRHAILRGARIVKDDHAVDRMRPAKFGQ